MIDCNSSGMLRIILFIKELLNIIKIAAPVILIIMCMIDIFKIITSNMEKINSAKQKIINRFLAAILVFLVPTFLNLTLEFLGQTKIEQFSCWIDATEENIKKLQEKEQEERELNSDGDLVYATQKIEESLKKRKELAENHKNEISNQPGEFSGKFPYYNQGTEPWMYLPFCSSSDTVQNSGCGAVSLAMLISGVTGSDANPKVVSSWFCSNGHDGGALGDDKITDSAFQNHFNIKTEVLWPRNSGPSLSTMKNKMLDVINQNNGVLLLIPGHFVAVVPGEGEKVQLLNPGKRADNGLYTIEDLYNKLKNYNNRCVELGKCGFMAAWSVAPR